MMNLTSFYLHHHPSFYPYPLVSILNICLMMMIVGKKKFHASGEEFPGSKNLPSVFNIMMHCIALHDIAAAL